MPIVGSNGGFGAQAVQGIYDSSGRPIISSSTEFGAEPLGIGPRNVALFGLANATFDLPPTDTTAVIADGDNPLPYWSLVDNTNNVGYATAIYDATSQTWGVNLNLGTAASASYLTLTTRSIVTTDDNLSLRQKAYLTMAKVGTYAGATQQTLSLTATYYDHTNTAISTATIGTALDNGSSTSISGFTTTGGTAFPSSAAYVDLEVKLLATAAVTSGISFTIKSLLLASSSSTTGSFVVSQAFTSSSTWNVPTGVSVVDVFLVGGGGGGASGALQLNTAAAIASPGGAGAGGGGAAVLVRNLAVTAGSSITIGIGTAGAGGTASSRSKTAGNTTTYSVTGIVGGAAGATTFGSLVSAAGGQGGLGGSSNFSDTAGGAGGTQNIVAFSTNFYTSAAGGNGGNRNGPTAGSAGASLGGYSFTQYPYVATNPSAGGSAGTGVVTAGTTGTTYIGANGASGSAGFAGSGGGGAALQFAASDYLGVGGAGGYGGGGAGAGNSGRASTAAGTTTITAASGGNAAANSGAGGGGGGIAWLSSSVSLTNQVATLTSGAGGSGGAGYLVVSWTA